MTSADALISGRLTRTTMSWLLIAVMIAAPVEALSADNRVILFSLPLRSGIRAVAATLTSLVDRDGVVCRWGGEEFLVLLPDADEVAASKTAELFRAGIATTGVTASVGVAEVRPGDTVAAWVARADAAMYAAKQRGRNQVVTAPRADATQDAASSAPPLLDAQAAGGSRRTKTSSGPRRARSDRGGQSLAPRAQRGLARHSRISSPERR